MKNKFLLIVIAILFAVSSLSLSAFAADSEGNLPDSNITEDPYFWLNRNGVAVTSYNADREYIMAGDHFKLTFILSNTTGVYLNDVKVTLPGLNSSKFLIDGGFTYKSVNIANGSYAMVVFDLIACEGINSIRETVTVSAEYVLPDGSENIISTDVILNCEPVSVETIPTTALDLTITGYKASSDRIRPDRVFTLTVTVENSGDVDIEKARVNILNLDGHKFAVNKGLTYQDFSIAAGETKNITFELIGCDGISSTREVLPVELIYGDYSDTIYCTLSCKPEENTVSDEQVFAPNIIITDYDFGGEFVTAGSKFPLTITFENASADATIENLKITINGASSSIDGSIAYSAANSANSFFFEKLDTKGSDSVTLEMLAKSDATPNSYPIDISFSYEYTANGKRYQASTVRETINVPLQQEDRLVVNEPYYPNWVVYVGESCYVSTSLVNMGKSGVYNVTASIEGEGFSMTESSYYIGNIESGREEYYDTEIYPEMSGEINCELVITYEDANGNAKEKRIPFTVNAQEMYFDDEFYYDEPIFDDAIYSEEPVSDGSNLPVWAWCAIGGGVLLVVIIIIIVSVKKKKAKAGFDEDDEDI